MGTAKKHGQTSDILKRSLGIVEHAACSIAARLQKSTAGPLHSGASQSPPPGALFNPSVLRPSPMGGSGTVSDDFWDGPTHANRSPNSPRVENRHPEKSTFFDSQMSHKPSPKRCPDPRFEILIAGILMLGVRFIRKTPINHETPIFANNGGL